MRIQYFQVVEEVKKSIDTQYKQYEKQHEEYAQHIKGKVEEKRRHFEQKKSLV